MTDVPSNIAYEDSFPALDGPNSNNNTNNNNNSTTSTNNQANSDHHNSWSTPSSQTNNITTQQQTTTTTTTSTTGQQQQQTKINYLSQIQQIYNQQQQQIQQQQQQQVLSHLVDSDHNSNAMVSKYHIQPQQQEQQQQQQQQQQPHNPQQNHSNNNNNINNNNNSSSTMQSNPSSAQQQQQQQQQKRPGLPNPILSSERCSTFKIAPEERRHRDFELEQSKILKEIMLKTNTKIEVTTTKDGALNFCIIGRENSLQAAKNLVLNDFQTSVTLNVAVPKSIHGRLLGPKGLRLAGIQDETQTKINIPRKDEDSDIIKIVGLKNNAELAVRCIQKYAREFAGKAMEKVSVERIYLLFITGPFNENLKRWEEMGAKVSTSCGLIPSNTERESGHLPDEVTFAISGETTAVNQVKEEIIQIYEDKKKKCTTVNMEVKKAQHKYILGPGGQNLRNLFAKTGVSVELPQESESETITLRGERSKLAPALSELYTQAHSETDDFFEVETWLHKYLIGARKTSYIDFKARGVDVKSFEDKIKLHGPPTEVENIKDILEAELETLRKTIIRKDIRVEPRIHGYIIGKAGATVDQIREESGAYVLVPKNDEPSEFITLEGTQEAVAIAEEKINAIAKKYEASRKLVIDQQLHGSIIGRGGEKIRSIREKFTQVVFTFPEQGSKNNEITILGPQDEVEECYNYLDEFHKQLQENNNQIQVPIRKDVIKYLPDAQSAIKRIKLDHKVKVDMFINSNNNNNNSNENNSSNINSNNKSASANKQQSISNSTNNESNNANNITSTIDDNTENTENSSNKKKGKGKANKNKQAAGAASGAPSAAAAAAASAKAPASENATNTNNTGSSNDINSCGENYAVIIGKKEDVDQAKVKLTKLLDELATTTELEVKISHKLRSFLGPKTKVYRQLLDDFQQKVVISFPPPKQQERSATTTTTNNNSGSKLSSSNDEVNQAADTNGVQQSTNGGNKNNNNSNTNRIDIVKIRGPKQIAKKAEKKFEALVAEWQEKMDKNFTTHVSIETAVIQKFTYSDKMKLNKIRDSQSVKLNIPDRRDTPQLQCSIVGYEKNVQAALQQFTKLAKEVEEREEETIEIASRVHPRLIGAGGKAVKKLMEDYKVGVRFARQGDPNPDHVTLSGRRDCITAAKNHMMKLADQYLLTASRANNNNGNSAANSNNNTTTSAPASGNNTNNNTNNSQQPQATEQPAVVSSNATGASAE